MKKKLLALLLSLSAALGIGLVSAAPASAHGECSFGDWQLLIKGTIAEGKGCVETESSSRPAYSEDVSDYGPNYCVAAYYLSGNDWLWHYISGSTDCYGGGAAHYHAENSDGVNYTYVRLYLSPQFFGSPNDGNPYYVALT